MNNETKHSGSSAGQSNNVSSNNSASSSINTPSNNNASSSGISPSSTCSCGTSSSSSGSSSFSASTAAQKCEDLLAQCPVTTKVAPWIKCLRTPAISLSYSLSKQHVPDIANAPSASGNTQGNGQNGGQNSFSGSGQNGSGSGSQSGSGCTCQGENGVNSDTMQCQGQCTIRYFDLLMGAVSLMALGALWRVIRR